MKVLVNYNIDSPKSRGLWYDFEISKVGSIDVIGKLYFGNGCIDSCNIKFIQEVMRIEEVTKKDIRKKPEVCKNSKVIQVY